MWLVAALLGVALLLYAMHLSGWLIALGVVLLYVAGAVWFPFTSCPRASCQGGRIRSPNGKNWRPCWWCRGRGSRVRLGRRLFENVTGRRKHT